MAASHRERTHQLEKKTLASTKRWTLQPCYSFGLWQRAVNCQPGDRLANSKRSPSAINFQEIWNLLKISSFFNFFEKLKPCRTLKFHYNFPSLLPFLQWQRAVNRQPGYHSGNSKCRSPSRSRFPENLKFSKKSHHFSTFLKSLAPIELWNFKVIFKLQYHFYKLQYVLQNNYDNSQARSESDDLQKLVFRGQAYLRAAAPAGPLSYCFGMATSGEPSTTRRAGALPLSFSRNFGIFRKVSLFSNFLRSLNPI